MNGYLKKWTNSLKEYCPPMINISTFKAKNKKKQKDIIFESDKFYIYGIISVV